MKKKGTPLPDEDHVMRYVSWARLRRDENENVIGFLGQAFELRPDEKDLSVNWLEYFDGNRDKQIRESVKLFRNIRKVGSKSAYGIGKVGQIKRICGASGTSIRIVYDPEDNNLSHSVIRHLPRDDSSLFEALATEVFTELVLNSSPYLDEPI
jgi:hypothetical protein